MNFFSERELDELTSPGVDGVMWLLVGLGGGYWLSDGVSNPWARVALVIAFALMFTRTLLSILTAIDGWRERRRKSPARNRRREARYQRQIAKAVRKGRTYTPMTPEHEAAEKARIRKELGLESPESLDA